ncbi:hypothetical protein BIT28_27365 [Photobacterium proteolyticum]|uniref:Carboxylic ester hydrolase n=1 Tax=Photobacterium proteolyticum TaxID=1903952 RepID=A0A1Q9G873_9GAMM|nr:hypothetical protein [Photobacterium proteolyticum]OLQ70538.1 hypothetical protein BIT28_27365 [Photobacterium proteolyticum]
MKWFVRFSAGLVCIFVLLVGVVMLLPAPEIPEPDGEHKVGVTEFEVQDGDSFVHVTAWYPAVNNAEGERLPYMPAYLAEALGKQQGFPGELMTDERLTKSIIDVEVLAGQHPVLLFNHGYGSFAQQNLTNMEQLASHGFVVLALGHPGHSLIVKRVNGDLVPQQQSVAISADDFDADIANRISISIERIRQSQSLVEWQQKSQQYEQDLMRKAVSNFQPWLKNNQLLLDALPDIASGIRQTRLTGHLDLNKLAAFGHSFGGSMASHLAMNDERVKAGFNLDGQHFSFSLKPDNNAPVCFAYTTDTQLEGVTHDYSWMDQQVAKANSGGGCEAVFTGAAHMNFSILNHLPYLKYAGILGSIDSEVMHNASNAMLVQFFDQHLRQGPEMIAPAGIELRIY